MPETTSESSVGCCIVQTGVAKTRSFPAHCRTFCTNMLHLARLSNGRPIYNLLQYICCRVVCAMWTGTCAHSSSTKAKAGFGLQGCGRILNCVMLPNGSAAGRLEVRQPALVRIFLATRARRASPTARLRCRLRSHPGANDTRPDHADPQLQPAWPRVVVRRALFTGAAAMLIRPCSSSC